MALPDKGYLKAHRKSLEEKHSLKDDIFLGRDARQDKCFLMVGITTDQTANEHGIALTKKIVDTIRGTLA